MAASTPAAVRPPILSNITERIGGTARLTARMTTATAERDSGPSSGELRGDERHRLLILGLPTFCSAAVLASIPLLRAMRDQVDDRRELRDGVG